MMSQLSPLRVLVVDDAAAVREALCWLLESEPELLIVGEASNGRDAVQQAVALRPDIVLLDVEMPLMDGYTAARRLKALSRPPIILFLTVHGDAEARARGAAAGGDGFAEKGEGWQALMTELHRVLDGRGNRF